MRLVEIHVDGFGALRDRSITDLPPGLCVFHGANEAGKSTLLAFVRRILFGFPDRRSNVNHYDCVHGGKKKGRLVFLRGDERVVVERVEGARGGPVKVVFADGTQGGEVELSRLLGSTTRDVYQSVLAFSLDELQTFETLASNQVADALSVAAMGENPQRLGQVRAEWENELRELFTPRAHKAAVTEGLRRIEDLRDRVREMERDPEAYARLCEEIASLEDELRSLESERREKGGLLVEVRNLIHAWPDWHARALAAAELAELPRVPSFPPDGIGRLETLAGERRTLERTGAQLGERLHEVRRELAAVEWDGALLAEARAVRGLERGLSGFEEAQGQVRSLERELQDLERRLESLAREIGPGWADPERLRRFDLSSRSREAFRELQEAVREGRHRVEALQREREAAERARAEAVEIERQRAEAYQEIPEPPPGLDEREIQAHHSKQQHFAAALRDLPLRREELRRERDDLARFLQEVDLDWPEERIEGLTGTVTLREGVRRAQDRLARADEAVTRAELAERQARERLEEARVKALQAEGRLGEAPAPPVRDEDELRQRRDLVRRLRARHGAVLRLEAEVRAGEQRLADLEESLSVRGGPDSDAGTRLPGWVWGAAGVGLVAVAGWALQSGNAALAAALAVLAAGGAVGYGLVRRRTAQVAAAEQALRRRRDQVRAEREALQDRLGAARKELADLCEAGGIPVPVTDEVLETLEAELDAWAGQLRERRMLLRAADEARAEQAEAGRRLEAAEQTRAEAGRALEAARREWADWLGRNGFDPSLSPDMAVDVLRRLEAARERMRSIRSLEDRIERMEETLRADVAGLNALLARLGRPPVEPEWFVETVGNLLAEADRVKELVRQKQAARERAEEARRNRERAEEALGQADERLRDARQALERAEAAWAAWVREQGLPEGLSVDAAVDVLRRVEACQEILDRIEEGRAGLEQRKSRAAEFLRRANEVLAGLGRPPCDPGQVPGAVAALAQDLEHAQRAFQKAEGLKARIADLEGELRSLEGPLRANRSEIEGLLRKAGARDEDEFRRKAEVFRRRAELEREVRIREASLANLLGDGALEMLERAYRERSAEDYRQQEAALAQELETLGDRISELHQRLGAKRRELDQLEKKEEISALRLRLAAETGALQDRARQWARLRLALFVLEKAREKYEESHRPEVLREAETTFARLTSGRYVGIRSPLGEKGALRVVAADRSELTPGQLSRGTAEQLYLSIRFGFVRRFLRGTEPLPLVFDDILVNFDPDRARAACEAIRDLADEAQILFFTCHPETVDRFRIVCPQLEVRELVAS